MSQQPRPGVSYAAATSSTSTDPTITTSTSTTSATPKRRRRVQVEEKSSPIRKFLNYPAVHVVIFVGIVVALGITWDAIYHTAYSTSKFDLRPKAAAHVWYFADKRNILNRIFVKRAAAWTTFGFLIPHAIFSPSRHHHPYFPSKPHRALEIGLYLVAWYVVTGWMTSYVRTTTGAVCQLPLPPQLAQNPSFSSLTRIDQLPIVRADDSGDVQSGTTFINVPQEYCSYGRNINPSAFPELFSLLKPRTKQLAEEGLYKPFNVDSTDFRARFFEGFDLSGHVFLLFASMAIITRQLAPALKMVYERGTLVEAPGKRIGGVQLAGHALSMVVGLGLVLMWSFMLWTTSAYFHTVPEKIAGYLVGIGAIFYIHLVSRSATAVAPNYFPRHG